MGGRFTSGLASASAVENSVNVTRTFGLGTNSQIYEMAGSWNGYPPGFGTWVPVTG
jgi:tetrahydromethanopterin S-methyltransferase subunit H